MVRPILLLVAAALAGCTVPAYQCGHAVPCARGSVQSCTSRDGARCRYLLSDGTLAECASCDDCFAAERAIEAWCAGDDNVPGLENPPSPSHDDLGVAHEPPRDLAAAPDLAAPRDLAAPVGDMSLGPVDTDLGCLGFGFRCDLEGDPNCCNGCCAGGCTIYGYCAAY